MARMKDSRLEPKLVRGPISIHVRNGGLPKDKPGRAFKVEKVETLVTVWAPPEPRHTPSPEELMIREMVSRPVSKRNTSGSVRTIERKQFRERTAELVNEQQTVERDLRTAGYTWRQVEKMSGGKYPQSAAEFLSRYVNPQGDAVVLAPRFDAGYSKTYRQAAA